MAPAGFYLQEHITWETAAAQGCGRPGGMTMLPDPSWADSSFLSVRWALAITASTNRMVTRSSKSCVLAKTEDYTVLTELFPSKKESRKPFLVSCSSCRCWALRYSVVIGQRRSEKWNYLKIKISSIGASTALEMSIANFKDGLYCAFSKRIIVSRRTPTCSANYSCVSSLSRRYFFNLHSKSSIPYFSFPAINRPLAKLSKAVKVADTSD